MKFLIVTGLSGAGKTSVLRHLEDSGYQCMDNIPPLLLAPAFTLCEKVELDTPVALGVDSRSGALFDADTVCSAIDQGGDSHEISILFLEADTETLIDRYKETRRDHPLMRGGITLEQAIAAGDGANDLEMIGAAALGIAYHAKPVVRAQARLAVTASGLDAITLLFIEAWR